MSSCELCGASGALFSARVESTTMKVCKSCSSFGKVLSAPSAPRKAPSWKRPPRPAKVELLESVVSDFSQRLRKAREKKGLTQKDFARLLSEKESLVHKMESGFLPPLATAKKIGRILALSLVKSEEETKQSVIKQRSSGPLTLGDLIKKK